MYGRDVHDDDISDMGSSESLLLRACSRWRPAEHPEHATRVCFGDLMGVPRQATGPVIPIWQNAEAKKSMLGSWTPASDGHKYWA